MANAAKIPSIKDAQLKKQAKEKGAAILEGRKKAAAAEEYILERLNVAQRLEAFLNRLEFDQLLKLEDGVKAVKERKRKEAEAERKAAEAREQAEQKLRELAAEHGIEIEVKGSAKKKRKSADPEKYAIHFGDTGNTYYWSGCGHAPKQFKAALDKGIKKDALINPKGGKPYSMAKEPS